MKKLLFLMMMMALPLVGWAQTIIATDNAGNYSSWTNGSNEGSGFGAWVISATQGTGFAGAFTGNPTDAAITGMTNPSFGLYANPAGSGANVSVERPFSAALNVGETFSTQWAVNWDGDNGSNGNKGIILYSGTTALVTINMAGSSTITIQAGENASTTMFSIYGTNPMTISFEYTSDGSILVSSTGRDGSESFSQTLTVPAGAPDKVAFYAEEMGAGNNRQPYFNNLKITAPSNSTEITDAPALSSPADDATSVSVTPTLSWSEVTNSTSYRVRISTISGDYSSPIVETTVESTSYEVSSALSYSTEYFWQVRGEADGEDPGPYSTERSFTTRAEPVTFTVYYNNPNSWSGVRIHYWGGAEGSTWPGVAMTAPEGNSPWYSYSVPEDVTNMLFNDATNENNKTADLTRSSTGYYNGVIGQWTDTDPFILSSGPILTTPANNATDVAVTTNFQWEALAKASTYTIEISTNSDFSSTLVSTTATSPYDLDSNLSYSTTYYWRVRGTNYAGNSDWSSASFTTTEAPTIGSVSLTTPSDDAVDQSTTPTLAWNAATNATGYRVQISTTSGDYNSPVVNTTVSSATSYEVASALSYSTEYFWRVQGTAEGIDDGPFSAEFSFTTMAQPSVGTLTLTTPADSATGVSIRPTFEWSSATNATTYRLQVSTDNFSTTAFETTTASTTYTILAANQLTGNTAYQWRVRGEADGHINGDYATGNFTTQETFILYYRNPNGWTTVKAYVWTTGNPDVPFVAWPGEDMTAPVTGSWYSYTVPVGNNRVIFHNNSGNNNIPADKTGDLERSTTGYYIGDGTTNLWSDTEPLQGVYTVQAGNWDATSTWNGGILPTSNDTVTIAHNVTLNVSDTVHTIIINSGVVFTADTNTLTLSSGGTFSNSGTINTGTSTIAFLGSGAITGSPTLYNLAIAGGVAIGSGTTINGTLTINAGGYLAQSKGGTGLTASSQVPNFGQSATLAYTGTFEYGNENFAGGFGNTEGKIPFNLTVAGTGALTITQNARTLAGKLTVESGATLTTNGLLTLNSGATADVAGILTGNITIEQKISGTQGWRLLAAPISSTTLTDITSGLWTQGFTGASTTEGNANVRFWNGSAYVAPSNIADAVVAGTGYAMLVFADDNFDGQADAFPKTMSVTGGWVNADVEVNLNQGNDVFTLVGNPFFSTIDSDNLTASNLYTTVYVYDQSAGQFISWNGETGGLTDGLIAPFQGFFVVNNSANASTLTIPTSAKTTGGVLHKEGAKTPVVAFTSTLGELSSSAYVSFTEMGSEGKDFRDAVKLVPLDIQPYLSVSTYNGSSYLDINNLPAELNTQLEIPVFVSAYSPENGVWNALTGEAIISWSELANWPESWVVELVDNETGETINMREVNQYSFMLTASVAKQRAVEKDLTPRMFSAEGSSRFTLKVGPLTTSVEGLELPTEVTLNQNYPNPFNPSTQISFALPQAMNISVKVYDMLGREVATLFNGAASAGTTNVQFNASNMSSGMYYYRLQAGEHAITKKMMLVK